MKGFLSQKEVEIIKEQYHIGTRIELIHMDDPYAPIESGMGGTIKSVDDAGTLLKAIFINAVNELIKKKWMLEKTKSKETPKISLELRQTEDRIRELEKKESFHQLSLHY